jgi:hypothetical protein
MLRFNLESYLPVRFFFLDRGWGDVYTFNGYYYRIQILGNELIPVAFFITFIIKDIKHKRLKQIVLLAGLLLAGNFAYFIAAAFFLLSMYLFYVKKISTFSSRFLLVFIFLILTCIPIAGYVNKTLERKQAKSLTVRSEQVGLLWDNLIKNPVNLIWGKGLGNTVSKKTAFRDYTGQYYYELQVFYIFNQLGLILFVFLLFNILISAFNYKGCRECTLLYMAYVVYAITNPYIINTTQVVVILLLNILSREAIVNKANESKIAYSPPKYNLA